MNRKFFLTILGICLVSIQFTNGARTQEDLAVLNLSEYEQLKSDFLNPKSQAKPWTFWYWMYGAVDSKAITADLEAMKEIGLEGAYLMPIKDTSAYNPNTFNSIHFEGKNSQTQNSLNSQNNKQGFPNPKIKLAQQLSPEWWALVNHSFKEADRLGLKMGMHISDGFALAGGPWIQPDESMQKIVGSELIVRGGSIKGLKLPQPETIAGYYKDLSVVALPLKMEFTVIPEYPRITSDNPTDSFPFWDEGLVNGKTIRTPKSFRAEKSTRIDYDFGRPVLVRNIQITPAGNNFQSQRFSVYASTDGINYQLVQKFTPPRQGWQNTGFDYTFAIPPTKARFFQLTWNPEGSEPGSEDLDAAKWKPTLKVNKITFNSVPKLNLWEGKAGLVWRIAEGTNQLPENQCFKKEEILDLTQFVENGVLNCNLPKGDWLILRIGHTSTGHTNATGGGGKGLEVDKFNPQAVQKQFNNWFGAIYNHVDSATVSRVLTKMHIDSWECGSQNWSENFAYEFYNRRKYDLKSLLPILLGYPIESTSFSEKVLLDVRITINELLQEVFFKVMTENAHQRGCKVSAESVAPTFISDGIEHFKHIDLPMGEYWLNSPTHDKPNDMLDAISGAHIYGKNLVQAEGFTQLRSTWNEHPQMLKPLLDRNFALGMNKLFFHIFTHNPFLDIRPGMTLDGIGLYFQRDQIWWKQGKSFIDYISSSQTLLQYGRPVIDLAIYTGEEIPSRSFTPDKLIHILPGLFEKELFESEKSRIENKGNPLKEHPKGVTHSAGTFNLDSWSDPLNGYKFDSYNKDALIKSTVDSTRKLVSPGGLAYEVFIIPEKGKMNPAGIKLSEKSSKKLEELRSNGLREITLPHTKPDFRELGLEPDLIVPSNIAWEHRKSDELDIYFLSNQSKEDLVFEASFRIDGKNAELWDAVNRKIYPVAISQKDKRSNLHLSLKKEESIFVIFTTEVSPPTNTISLDTSSLETKWDIELVRNGISIKNSSLFDLSTHTQDSIKYYSGEIKYKTLFEVQKLNKSKRIVIDLGKLSNLATVFVNGIDCGTVWISPFQLDITKALKKGKNKLEIEITNSWANAIQGADLGKAPYEGVYTNGKYRKESTELESTGLLGPINLITKTKETK